MTPEQRQQAQELFDRVVAEPPRERGSRLDELCSDPAVRVEVEKRLEAEAFAAETAPVDPRKSAPGRGPHPYASPPSESSTARSIDHGRFVPGTVLSERYRIVGLIGKGGMGEVYRADDLELGQSVALKFLPEKLASDSSSLDRFRNEVRLARQVSHPNVCRVHDIGHIDNAWYLSMEYVDGEDLSILLKRIGRFPRDRAVEIARQLCLGLAAAHEKGVLHRDLKPANVMVDGRGKVLITDFGLADFTESVPSEDVRSGTPAYMAPEQLLGREVTEQSDVYSLGLVLHEVFTGKPVWEADTLAELFKKRQSGSQLTPASQIEELDPDVGRVIRRCLEADPKNRFGSAMAVAVALPGGDPVAAALAAGETPSPELVAASGGSQGLSPRTAGVLLVAVLAALFLPLLIWPEPFRAPEPPESLVRDCQEILTALGHFDRAQPPVGMAFGFEYAADASPPAEVEFWFRTGPTPLTPIGRQVGRVTEADPPFTVPGMVTIRVDSSGRLLELRARLQEALPLGDGNEGARKTQPSWEEVFRFAGLDPAEFSAVDGADGTPGVFADEHRVWMRQPSEAGRGGRVEAATLSGRWVWFRVVPDVGSEEPAGAFSSEGQYDYATMTMTLYLVLFLIAAPLAYRNLTLGRSDRRGAFRIAVFFFVLDFAMWLLGGTHVPEPAVELRLILYHLMTSVYMGFRFWVFYIALEPYVRRLWPEALITWSRLLAGRVRDTAVGRDLLVGGGCFAIWMVAGIAAWGVENLVGADHAGGFLPQLPTLLGGRFVFAELFDVMVRSVGNGVFFLVLLLLLRVALRREWLAILVFAIIWCSMWIPGRSAGAWVVGPVVLTSIAIVLARFGLFACIASLMFLYSWSLFPVSMDTTRWYWDTSLFALLFMVGMAVFGFWCALGRNPLLREEAAR